MTCSRNMPTYYMEKFFAKVQSEMSSPIMTATMKLTSRRKFKLKWQACEIQGQSSSLLMCGLTFSAVDGSHIAKVDEKLTSRQWYFSGQ